MVSCRVSRVLAAVGLVAVTLAGAQAAEAAGEVTVTVAILRGTTPTTNVRRNEAVTIRVTVTNNEGVPYTLNSVTLATSAGLTGTASLSGTVNVPANDARDVNITGMQGSMLAADTLVSVTATADGTYPDDTVEPPVGGDPGTALDQVIETSAPATTAPLVDFSVETQLRRGVAGADNAAGYLVGEPVTVRTIVASNLPVPITIQAGAVVLTPGNLGGAGAANGLLDVPLGTPTVPGTRVIDAGGFTAGPGTPASASAVVTGSVVDGTLLPDDVGGARDDVSGASSSDTATVGSFTVSTVIALAATPDLPAPSLLTGQAVSVRVRVTTNLSQALTLGPGAVVLTTRDNLTGTASSSAGGPIAAGMQTTDFYITGLTAGPGSPARAAATVSGQLPDDTLVDDPAPGSSDAVSANNTATPAVVAVLAPTFTLTAVPAPPGNVARGGTVTVTARLFNPLLAPALTNGKIVVTASPKTLIGGPTTTPAPPPAPVTDPVANTVTVDYPSIGPGETKEVVVPTTVKMGSDAPKVGGPPPNDFFYTATFEADNLPVTLAPPALNYEIRADADIQMIVVAPPTRPRSPSVATVDVAYSVLNAGPDPAAGLSFVAPVPPPPALPATLGLVGTPVVTDGTNWECTVAPSNEVTCDYVASDLAAGATSAAVMIRWQFNTNGPKVFGATASSGNDPATGNNTTSDTTTVEDPISRVGISATATPDPATVAVDVPAEIEVDYEIENIGDPAVDPALSIRITPITPAGATLVTLTGGVCGVSTCDFDVDAGDTVTITATYTVPQGSFVANEVVFQADIAPLNGSIFAPGSVTSATDRVVGQVPQIDIGLAPVPGGTDINVPDDTVAPPVNVPRTFTFQNFSTVFPVRAGTASVVLTIPAAPSPSIGTPAGCDPVLPATVPPTVRCVIAGPVPAATGPGSPGTVDLTLTIPLLTADPVTVVARVEVIDPGNRNVVSTATPDSREFQLDLNRTPSVVAETAGPGLPGRGAMFSGAPGSLGLVFRPLPLHDDDDGDNLLVVANPNICATASSCVLSPAGGAPADLAVVGANDRVTVTFTSVAAPVTLVVTYGITDGKSTTSSTFKVKLLPAIVFDGGARPTLPGSFGRPLPGDLPFFGTDITPGDALTNIDVLQGDLGADANGVRFTGTITYDLATDPSSLTRLQESLNVQGSTAAPEGAPGLISYVPAPGFTSDPRPAGGPAGPPDSFTYTTSAKLGSVELFTVEAPVVAVIKNQNPIGVDDDNIDVQNDRTKKTFPLLNDLDGNTVATAITVKKNAAGGDIADPIVFDDNNKANTDAGRGLRIMCIGPIPSTPPGLDERGVPEAAPSVCPAGFVGAGEALVLQEPTFTADTDPKATVTLAGASTPAATLDDFRALTVAADSTIGGDLQFAYIVVDERGGAGFGRATVKPNSSPEVLEGVRTVFKNTPTIVVDTSKAVQDVNVTDKNTIEVSTADVESKEKGKVVISDTKRTITYTPAKDFLGRDELQYSVTDGRTGAASAVLQLNVVEQPGSLPPGADAAGGGGATPAGNLAATGGNPLPLTGAAGFSLVLGLVLVQAGRRRQSRPLLDGARHLRT